MCCRYAVVVVLFYTCFRDKLLDVFVSELQRTSENVTNYEATCKLTIELATYWNDRAMEGQYELGGHILWPWRGAEARAVALFGMKAGRTTLPLKFFKSLLSSCSSEIRRE